MIFEVKSPIPGFEHISKMEIKELDNFFIKLESKDDETSFTLINPYALREYSFEIPPFYQELLQITKESNLRIYNVMVISSPIETSTINFIAPLIFNVDTKTMAQVVLDNLVYPEYGLAEKISDFIQE